MLEVYTDVSVSKGSAVATCLVASTDNFVGYNTFEYSDIHSSLHGELLAIRDGLKYATENCTINETLTVYSDSNSALQRVKSRSCESNATKHLKSIITEICSLCDDYTVNFLLIKGHQIEHNPNKVVDLMSNTVLRYTLNEKE